MRADKPEIWLAIHGYLIAFLWEMLQMPFYMMSGLTAWEVTVRCSLATFGDAGIMVLAYLIASLVALDRNWLRKLGWRPVLAYVATGQIVTITVELVAVRVPWGWSYSERMPVLLDIGLVPVLMWIIVPLLALALAARSTRVAYLA